jgi:flagellar motor switch protein FliM
MEKVLNQQEIDAMVRKARSDNAPVAASGPTVASGPVVQPWNIRQAGQIGREQLRAINQLHELFARNLTTAVGGYLRIIFDCSLVSAEHLTFIEFLERLPEKAYLASIDLKPVGATAVLQLDLDIAFPIVDLLLGGEGASGAITRDTTEIEDQVLAGIVGIACRELQSAWQAIALEFNFGARQRLSQTQSLMPLEEKNLCLSFEVKMLQARGTLNLAIPAVVSNALLRKISADFSYQRPRTSLQARHQLQSKLLNCFFPVELSMPGLHVPLQNITDLAPGQVLPFSRPAAAQAILLVEDVWLCSAVPVRVSSRRAARVVSLEAPISIRGKL